MLLEYTRNETIKVLFGIHEFDIVLGSVGVFLKLFGRFYVLLLGICDYVNFSLRIS